MLDANAKNFILIQQILKSQLKTNIPFRLVEYFKVSNNIKKNDHN